MSTLHTSPLREKPADFDLSEYYNDHGALLSKAQRMYVSMADGKGEIAIGHAVYFEQQEAYVELALGGSLVIAKPVRPFSGSPGPGQFGGLRGEVMGFSSASRRRLMRTIASVERKERPAFVTLTYPDLFAEDMDRWKRDMDTFGKRFRRKMPEAGFLWRIEFKERKTGENAGKFAPHFHLLVYRAKFSELRMFVPRAWHGVVGSGNGDHLAAGTRVERIYSLGGVMRYVGKYLAKEDDFPPEWTGRVWGIIGREEIPWAVRIIIPLTEREGIILVRLGRKMVGLVGKTLVNGLTWIMNAERVLDYLETIQGFT